MCTNDSYEWFEFSDFDSVQFLECFNLFEYSLFTKLQSNLIQLLFITGMKIEISLLDSVVKDLPFKSLKCHGAGAVIVIWLTLFDKFQILKKKGFASPQICQVLYPQWISKTFKIGFDTLSLLQETRSILHEFSIILQKAQRLNLSAFKHRQENVSRLLDSRKMIDELFDLIQREKITSFDFRVLTRN